MDELARSYSEDSMIYLDEEPKSRKGTNGRKGGKGKGKRVIESSDDYELIEQEDESEPSVRAVDEDVLTYHREVRSRSLARAKPKLTLLSQQLCDKCFRPSAKELGKARKKRGRGKRRKVQEFEEESGDEAERLMGWIECEKCTVAFHWVSLPWGVILPLQLIKSPVLFLELSARKYPSEASRRRQGVARRPKDLLQECSARR
jgi:hypothetical protein